MNTSTTIKESGSDMVRKIRARFSRGVFMPLEKVEFPEDKEVDITIEENLTKTADESFLKAAGSWKGLIDAEELINNIYADRLISTRPEVKL